METTYQEPAGRAWHAPAPAKRTHRETWIRGLYTVFFMVIYSAIQTLLTALVLFQFVWSLIDGKPNGGVAELGRGLGTYAAQIIGYVTYASNERPFPFGRWPG